MGEPVEPSYKYPTQDMLEFEELGGLSDKPQKAAESDSDVMVMESSPVFSSYHPDNQLGMSPSYFDGMGPTPSPMPTEIALRQKEPTSHTPIILTISFLG